MELRWDSPETMTIPNVGCVRQGVLFTIDDPRGQDLIERGLASLPRIQQNNKSTEQETSALHTTGEIRKKTPSDAIPVKKE